MATFCRITGQSRGLPKPNFFPIIPPVSPADARRLCRITSKRMDKHHYVPLLEFGKRPACVRAAASAHAMSASERGCVSGGGGGQGHRMRDDYKYMTPILKKEMMDQSDLKSFEELQKILKRLKKELLLRGENGSVESGKFVYLLEPVLCSLIVPGELEEAIRTGEIELISLSKMCDKALLKVKGKPTLFVPLKEVNIKKADFSLLFDGTGQSKETLGKQKKIIMEKKKKTLAHMKLFEDLEKKNDEEAEKENLRPKGMRRKRTWEGKSKEAQAYRLKIEDFHDRYTPAGNMAIYGEWNKAIDVREENLAWPKIGKVKAIDLNTSMPPPRRIDPFVQNGLGCKKRERNVYLPDMNGLEIVPMLDEIEEVTFYVPQYVFNHVAASKSKKPIDQDENITSNLKAMFSQSPNVEVLPTLAEVEKLSTDPSGARFGYLYNNDDGQQFCLDNETLFQRGNYVNGAIVSFSTGPKFIPGEIINTDMGIHFVPGHRPNDTCGFVPGIVYQENGEMVLVPGYHGGLMDSFVAGQVIAKGPADVSFVPGQVVHSERGAKFVEGATIGTPDGLKFVAGLMGHGEIEGKFFPGALIETAKDVTFVPGQMLGGTQLDELIFVPGEFAKDRTFVPGQTVATENGSKFLHGQIVETAENEKIYLPGQVITSDDAKAKQIPQFTPGKFCMNPDSKEEFLPGCKITCRDGRAKFAEGKFVKFSGECIFVPGKSTLNRDGSEAKYEICGQDKLNLYEILEDCSVIDSSSLSFVYKLKNPIPGYKVFQSDGQHKFVEGSSLPEELQKCDHLEGRMEFNEDGPKFVPGQMVNDKFVPGKEINGKFVPGRMIETKDGEKFVAGQWLETADGRRFISGQVMKSKDGSKFVPGQVIETKSGSKFIPGQLIMTDDGAKFVPGEIVETEKGAMFVPGQVINSPDGACFVPGQVVETEEGPRFLPPEVSGDEEYLVQGFDIDQEEMRQLVGKMQCVPDIVETKVLKLMAEGFEPIDDDGSTLVMNQFEDVDKILSEEMLDAYDSMDTRNIIKNIFLSIFAQICEEIDEIVSYFRPFLDDISIELDATILSDKKLNPALELLKKYCLKKNPDDPEEYDVLKLISGIIFCSIPGALKESCGANDVPAEEKFKNLLLECIAESIRNILEEEGIVPRGLTNDIKELIKLAKYSDFDDTSSFFSKVEAISEGRCNAIFMNNLLKSLAQDTESGLTGINVNELAGKLVGILSSRLHLQKAFQKISSNIPEFINELLQVLKNESPSRILEGDMVINLLHTAIANIMDRRCRDELKNLSREGITRNQDVRTMLQQAVGLARYMKRPELADTINCLLENPDQLEMIKDDPIIQDVLMKIVVMRKLAEKDSKKRSKLEKLMRDSSIDSEDEKSLKELMHQSEALIEVPKENTLRKSKSMIKKSQSIIMSAKDIPMNAFLAMKNTESTSSKDPNWVKKFLQENVVGEVPWECAKACIILKHNYQAIIPKNASRGILMGETSYTLIDDDGIKFFLSPKDKAAQRPTDIPEPSKNALECVEDVDSTTAKEFFTGFKKSRKLEESVTRNYQPVTPVLNKLENREMVENAEVSNFSLDTSNRNFSDDNEEEIKGLEQYRPSSYMPPDTDDIQDIMNRYSRVSRTTGMAYGNAYDGDRRYRKASYNDAAYDEERRANQYDDVNGEVDEFEREMRDRRRGRRADYEDDPDDYPRRGSHNPEDPSYRSVMSDRTASLLKSVNETTAALEEESSNISEFLKNPRRSVGRSSAKRENTESDKRAQDYQKRFDETADDLANRVLGRDADIYTRKGKSASNEFSECDTLPFKPLSLADDDNTDEMIKKLKQKTTRKPMEEVIMDLEKTSIKESTPIDKSDKNDSYSKSSYSNKHPTRKTFEENSWNDNKPKEAREDISILDADDPYKAYYAKYCGGPQLKESKLKSRQSPTAEKDYLGNQARDPNEESNAKRRASKAAAFLAASQIDTDLNYLHPDNYLSSKSSAGSGFDSRSGLYGRQDGGLYHPSSQMQYQNQQQMVMNGMPQNSMYAMNGNVYGSQMANPAMMAGTGSQMMDMGTNFYGQPMRNQPMDSSSMYGSGMGGGGPMPGYGQFPQQSPGYGSNMQNMPMGNYRSSNTANGYYSDFVDSQMQPQLGGNMYQTNPYERQFPQTSTRRQYPGSNY